jgi:CHAT domain-containing protein
MHPTLKLFGLAIAPLVLCLQIAVLMDGGREGATLAVSAKQHAQETISEKKAEGDRLFKKGLQQQETGNYIEAIQSFEQALAIYQIIKNRRGEARSNIGLAGVYNFLSQYEKAIFYCQQSLPILQELKEYNLEALALGVIGDAYNSLSQYEKSIVYYQQSVIVFQKVKDSQGEAGMLNSIGLGYNSLSEYEKAIVYFQQTLTISRQIKDRKTEAMALCNAGIAYRSLSQYAEAMIYYRKGLPIYQQLKDRKGEAVCLMGLGIVHSSLSQYKDGRIHFEKALLIYQEIEDRIGEANALMNLGSSYQNNPRTEYGKLIDYYQKALKIFQETKNYVGEGNALSNLSNAYNALSEYDKAIDALQKSLLIFQQIKDVNGEAGTLSSLGITYLFLSQNNKAISSFQQAIPLFQKVKDRAGEAGAFNNLGQAFLLNKNLGAAEPSFLKAIEVYESLRPGLTDVQRRALFEEQDRTFGGLQKVQVALQKPGSALETSDRGRARAFIELLAARFAGETLENAIVKQKVERLSSAQIQQVAKTQNAILVQYSVVSDKDLYIYIIQPDGRISFRKTDLTSLGKSLNNFVTASRDGLGVRGRTDRAEVLITMSPEKQRELQEQRDHSLRQLHQLLIEPIADLLPKNETDRVIFMPQGELFLVPFPALLNDQNQPLISQHTILTAPSIQTLDLTHKTAQNRSKANRPALVVGNPTMPAVSTVIGNPAKTLDPLPGAEKEAAKIAQLLNTQAVTGSHARKDRVMQQMQNAGIIHFATHGLLDSFKGDTPGAIALAPNGTNQPNDGLLTSGEIFDLKLNADLVVLSACDTGRGDITGDGVIGLSRSLFVAGVPSVIVSLWKVPDDSTAELMTEFYKNWQDRKLDKAQALRQAMLTTMKTNPNPRDWAAFTLIGESQ